MPSIEELKLGEPTTTLIKGPNGYGKTIAAASYPAPVFDCDFDGRVDPLSWFYRGERKKEIYYQNYGIHNLFPFLDMLDRLLAEGVISLDGRIFRPGTVIVDSVTSLSITSINYQMNERRLQYKRKPDNKQKRTPSGILLPDWDEYSGETMIFTQVLDVCKAIPKRHGIHIIFTAHPIAGTSVKRDEEGKVSVTTKVSPIIAIGKKPAELTPNYFNEIYHLGLAQSMNIGSKAKRIAFTQTIGDDMAKTAMPLPPSFEWTDLLFYDRLIELAKEGEENGGMWDVEETGVASSGW